MPDWKEQRVTTYIQSLESPENLILEQIEQEALDTYVPVIRKETQSFLKVLLMIKRPSRDRDGHWFFSDFDERIYAERRACYNHREIREENPDCTGELQARRQRREDNLDRRRRP